jgi:hypothetical protein
VLQLQAQPKTAPWRHLTRELAGWQSRGYVEELRNENLPKLAQTDRIRRDAKRAAYGVAAFAALLGLASPITRTRGGRASFPVRRSPPFSFTQLEITDPNDDSTAVVYGQSR